jgi:hypothetical protein
MAGLAASTFGSCTRPVQQALTMYSRCIQTGIPRKSLNELQSKQQVSRRRTLFWDLQDHYTF